MNQLPEIMARIHQAAVIEHWVELREAAQTLKNYAESLMIIEGCD